jgi:hypothetical protein
MLTHEGSITGLKWPASNRNTGPASRRKGGRLQVGTLARFASESAPMAADHFQFDHNKLLKRPSFHRQSGTIQAPLVLLDWCPDKIG